MIKGKKTKRVTKWSRVPLSTPRPVSVLIIPRQFILQHNAVKFEAIRLLLDIFHVGIIVTAPHLFGMESIVPSEFCPENDSRGRRGEALLTSHSRRILVICEKIPFHLVTRLWDTYLAEGDALPDFLVYIFASFLLTKLDFQELVMFLQQLPTHNWTHQELEMVLSRAYVWHCMFNSSPSHLAKLKTKATSAF